MTKNWNDINANTGENTIDVTVTSETTGESDPNTGDESQRGERTSSLVDQSSGSQEPLDPERIISITQPYCFSLDGTGQLDCFETASIVCGDEGSQWVIQAQYPANDLAAIERVGSPFCSDPAEPVILDPASGTSDTPPMPVVTLADFRALDIAPSEIESDSGGFGLIRGNTNFFATEEDQTLNTTMLGQQVAIQAVPVQWTWDYGDGSEQLSNPYPGGPQVEFNQETTTSHVYEDTGQYAVGLTTSYRGQFSVNDGPWIAIPGTAEVPSAPVTADIWRSQSKNVADDCHENPEGWACGNPFVDG
ncbi:PKD domain-containing protein [Citricoccus sp. K5]|uniref:PKD domain-containing protein n=1 Tax=Citricoccus sp. K5 TaxID=2653135 RepID=UPI001F472761|nr:PKD domain-containing protein [Citricoccus sp. K5]